jgi:uncharacterized protein
MGLKSGTKKIIRRTLYALLLIFLLMNIVAWFHAYKFTHFDSGAKYKTQGPSNLTWLLKIKTIFLGISNPRPENKEVPRVAYETLKLYSNKIIECWLIKSNQHRGTVVVFHGYGGDKSSMLDKAYTFSDLGFQVLLVDFMGSGGSEGNQTTIGWLEAAEVKTAYRWLDSLGEKNIILFGTSMGAVAIMKAVANDSLKPAAIILECPFGTLLETVQTRFRSMHIPVFPMSNLLVFWGGVQNGFNAYSHQPVKYASSIKCPTLLFYGEKDEKVSKKETDDIFRNLDGPKKLVTFPLAGHGNYLVQYKTKWSNDIAEFLNAQLKK